ncbi:MAG TPA: phosphotransferase [Marmoricola sp.]
MNQLLARYDEALMPGVMGPRLADLTGRPGRVCHVLDGKFEAGVRAVVLYDVAGSLMRGDLLPAAGDARPERRGITVAPGVSISLFPRDPDLPMLARVLDASHLGSHLSSAGCLHRGEGGARAGRRIRLSVLRYRPGKRATVLLEIPGGRRLVAKVYHQQAKAAAVAAASIQLQATCGSSAVLRLAPTVAELPALGVVVQERVRGVPLDLLVDGPRGPLGEARKAVALAGRALAEFHEAPVPTDRPRPVEGELRRLADRTARIGTVAPRLGALLVELEDRLVATRAAVPQGRPGHVHGDCKPSQFLVSDRHAHLMDLDHVGLADQVGDVATFLASLRQLSVRRRMTASRGGTSDQLAELRRTFLGAYRDARGDSPELSGVRWHEAVALERKALRAFARAPGSPLPVALVGQAHRCLDELGEGA